MPGWVNIGEGQSDNREISCKAKLIEHFSSLFKVISSSKLITCNKHYHDCASSKDSLAQSMQHGFATFQFDAQRSQAYSYTKNYVYSLPPLANVDWWGKQNTQGNIYYYDL